MIAERLVDAMYTNKSFAEMRDKRASVMASFLTGVLDQGKRVLEIGTGKGDIFNILANRYPKQYISIDIKDQVVGKNKGPQGRVVADGLRLPFNGNQFDLCYTCAVWHHLPRETIVSFIKESLRVSQSGLVIEDSIDDPLLGSLALRNKWVRLVDGAINVGVPGGQNGNQRLTPEWEKIVNEAGGEIIRIQRFEHPVLGIIPYKHVVYSLKKISQST